MSKLFYFQFSGASEISRVVQSMKKWNVFEDFIIIIIKISKESALYKHSSAPQKVQRAMLMKGTLSQINTSVMKNRS